MMKRKFEIISLIFLFIVLVLLLLTLYNTGIENQKLLDLEKNYNVSRIDGEYLVKCENGSYEKVKTDSIKICNKFVNR